jgi:hypothetical protein
MLPVAIQKPSVTKCLAHQNRPMIIISSSPIFPRKEGQSFSDKSSLSESSDVGHLGFTNQ